MPRRRVGVLTDDQHPDGVERGAERPQHQVAGGKVRTPLAAQPVAEGGDVGRHGGEGLDPRGVDEPGVSELGEALAAHAASSSRTDPCEDHGKSIHNEVCFHE